MDLPFLNNDITGSEPTVKILDKLQISVIGLICDKLEISGIVIQVKSVWFPLNISG